MLERKASRLGQCQIIAIRNADNDLTAAAFVVWDAHTMYYLIPCYSPAFKDSGAGALLVLEALKLAREKGVAFDFASMETDCKDFGAKAARYAEVSKTEKWLFFPYRWLMHLFRKAL